jgi:lipopolysaccharide transport system ATP-binding protein
MKDVTHSLNPWAQSQEMNASGEIRDRVELRPDEFWALQDINFEVRRGECLGLIGHNGAGKSTLLKILNGLIRPDSGRITMRGRVGALIELSAGFNPILTGRENIFNQAALLGFSTKEIREKYDAIVDFSELEEFLEMPVQNYSSGMKVKLGFAVSSQLEPDILLIDEVLAVGDLGFRYKCLNKIGELLRRCAVVFVSHSMTQIMRVSSNIMMLQSGAVKFSGSDIALGLEAYFQLFDAGSLSETGTGEVTLQALEANGSSGYHCDLEGDLKIDHGDDITIGMLFRRNSKIERAVVQVLFWNHEMLPVLDVASPGSHGHEFEFDPLRPTELRVLVPNLQLNSGRYYVSVIVTSPKLERVYCQIDHAFKVSVGSGSPASGAGCVTHGAWNRVNEKLSLATRKLFHSRQSTGRKVSENDDCIFDEVAAGDIAIDCGANVGLVTARLAATGAEVHAFEPDPVAFKVLSERFVKDANVHCHNMAVSSSNGTMKLYFREEREENPVSYSVGSTLIASKSDVRQSTFTEVRVCRLADFLKRFERVRFLKLDIEGAECDVLEDLIQEQLLDRIDLTVVETHEEWIPETIPRIARIRTDLEARGINNVFLNWI